MTRSTPVEFRRVRKLADRWRTVAFLDKLFAKMNTVFAPLAQLVRAWC